MGAPCAASPVPVAGDEVSHWPYVSLILNCHPALYYDSLYYDKTTRLVAFRCQISPLLSGESVLLTKQTVLFQVAIASSKPWEILILHALPGILKNAAEAERTAW